MSSDISERPKPVGIALVICDNVYKDSTGKRALIGLFNEIRTAAFPANHNRLCVLVSLTDLRPHTVCKLDVVHAETDEPVIEMEGPLPVEDPTTICDLVFELRELQFPSAGTYYIRFFGNEQILIQRPIEVIHMSQSSDRSGRDDN